MILVPTGSSASLAAAKKKCTDCARMFRRSSSAVATSREGHRLRRLKVLKQERADPTVEHEGQHAAHRRFWRVWDMPSLTSRKDFNFVIGEHTIAVFWKPLALFWTTEAVLRSALTSTRTLGVTEVAMRIMRKIGLRRRQSVKTGHGHMLEPARSAAPCEDHRSGRAARR